jgi:hypothetical protein
MQEKLKLIQKKQAGDMALELQTTNEQQMIREVGSE